MVFPLLFPSGDLGWSTNYKKKHNGSENDYVSVLRYYAYRIAFRPKIENFNPILSSGRLSQQFFIHAYVMVESNRMRFFRQNQKKITNRMLPRITGSYQR